MNSASFKSKTAVENFPERPGLTRAEIVRETRASMVGQMIDDALQQGMSKMHYALILVADGRLLEFDEFLQGRAEVLLRNSEDLEAKFTALFPVAQHGAGNEALRLGNIPLDVEISLYRRLAQNEKFEDEQSKTADEIYAAAVELYAQIECFMRAVDSCSEQAPGIERVGAPRFANHGTPQTERRLTA